MQADWSVEIGADLPSIIVPWRDPDSGSGFIDLRGHPEAVDELSEAREYPALGLALSLLNAPDSQTFTSKCDAWRVAEDELSSLDIDDAEPETEFAIAAYVDVVLREAVDFASFQLHENWLRRLTHELRALPAMSALVDLTLRWAQVEDNEGFGVTIHVTGYGRDEATALEAWYAALAEVVELIARGAGPRDLPPQDSGE